MVPAVPVVELRARRWNCIAPLVLLLAVVGAYICVPDTEFVRPLLAAAVVTAFLAPLPERAASQLGSGVVAALLLWTVGIESIGRSGALVGAIGCVFALALFPALPEGRPLPRTWWIATGTTVLLVLWCSRVAGLVDSGWIASIVVALGFVVAIVVSGALAGGSRLRRR